MCKQSCHKRCREGMGPTAENNQRCARHKNALRNHNNNNANRVANRENQNPFNVYQVHHNKIGCASPSSRLQIVNGNTDRKLTTSPVHNSPSKTVSPFSTSPPRSPAVPNIYSGSKFHDPPSPKVLPRPPVHWVENSEISGVGHCAKMTSALKVMLKVQA